MYAESRPARNVPRVLDPKPTKAMQGRDATRCSSRRHVRRRRRGDRSGRDRSVRDRCARHRRRAAGASAVAIASRRRRQRPRGLRDRASSRDEPRRSARSGGAAVRRSGRYVGSRQPTSTTTSRRGPCTPATRFISIRSSRRGPDASVIGRPARAASASSSMPSGTLPTSSPTGTTHTCRSGTSVSARRPSPAPPVEAERAGLRDRERARRDHAIEPSSPSAPRVARPRPRPHRIRQAAARPADQQGMPTRRAPAWPAAPLR